jgi:hypothetical protein
MVRAMTTPSEQVVRAVESFADEVQTALGDALLGLHLYGSAAGGDFVSGRSDVNVMIVVRAVSRTTLDALASLLPPWRRRGFALPLVVDEDFLERARDAFPIELDDARRCHRTLVGPDVLATIRVDRAHLRRQCEQEARAKQLRLQTLYLDAAARGDDLDRLLVESIKTFLVILRHVLHLRGDDAPFAYDEVLAAGERWLGPLPSFHRVLAHRRGADHLSRHALLDEFGRYLADVERIVGAVDTLHG